MKELATKFKARGKDGEGKVHTGWLSVYFLKGELKTYIQEEAEENKPAMTFYVEPESIAQFVGYDADGNEIYEGDILIDDNGDEHIAGVKCVAMLLDDNENTFVDIEDLKLKGRRENEN